MDTNDFLCLHLLFTRAGCKVRKYSGRLMHGKVCLGIEAEGNVWMVLGDVLDFIGEWPTWNSPEDESISFADVLADALRSAQTDSMGKGMILYFPSVQWVETVKEKEEESTVSE